MAQNKRPILLIIFRVSLIASCAIALCMLVPARVNAADVPYRGVNLSGAEFKSKAKPGTYGKDYIYPSPKQIDYFIDAGMNTFRLPFLWERLQRAPSAPLDTDELGRIDAVVEHATARGASVILDPHNYARYNGEVLGGDGPPIAVLADLWRRLAAHYKDNQRVIFGLMNEPNKMSTELWRDNANAAIRAIRNTGAHNLVLVPGNGWSGAHSWASSYYGTPNAVAMLAITDPADNFAFEAHQYLDDDSSGTSDQCVDDGIGARRLAGFTAWLKTNERRGFLGEFAGGRSAGCSEALDSLLTHIDDNADVWLGWTYWAAGPWWGEYMFTVEPTGCPERCKDRPQMAVLARHLHHH